jgi:hypothetical protein
MTPILTTSVFTSEKLAALSKTTLNGLLSTGKVKTKSNLELKSSEVVRMGVIPEHWL